MNIAIVGSGASAWAAVQGARMASPDARIDLFDDSDTLPPAPRPTEESPEGVRSLYDGVYQDFKKNQGLTFPPLKNHFGRVLRRVRVSEGFRFFNQPVGGGLTSVWGATCLPLLPEEWKGCPVGPSEMAVWYDRIADAMGIAGDSGPLDELFPSRWVNRPALRLVPPANRLRKVLEDSRPFRVGQNRIAIETREDAPNACTYCGECMMGCYRGAIWSAARAWGDDPVFQARRGKVRRLESGSVETEDGTRHPGYDRILLAAGAYGSSKLVFESFPQLEPDDLQDNAIFQFPIVDLRPEKGERARDYNALSQLLLIHPGDEKSAPAQIQIYPHFDTLLRATVPEALWPLLRGSQRWARRRILWARLYSTGRAGHRYGFRRGEQGTELQVTGVPDRQPLAGILAALRGQLKGSGFWVPPLEPICSKSSSHLSGPYSWKHPGVSPLGEVASGVHLVDGTLFPESPVTSPTFAIMANAMRMAHTICSEATGP